MKFKLWTQSEIANLQTKDVQSLLVNAKKHNQNETIELCNEEIARRGTKISVSRSSSGKAPGVPRKAFDYVTEFHFVCEDELGVTRNENGTLWTGTWVVAEKHANEGVKYRSVVALHKAKALDSYLQGTILEWRKSPRQPKYSGESKTRIEIGIDFLITPVSTPLQWVGNGSGEKGYRWKESSSSITHSHSMVPGGFDVTS